MKDFNETCGRCGNVFNSYITETCPLCRLRELIAIYKREHYQKANAALKRKLRQWNVILNTAGVA